MNLKHWGMCRLDVKDGSVNVLEAIAAGTIGGLQLALNVGAMLIVFLALIAVVNGVVGWVGMEFGYVTEHVSNRSGRSKVRWEHCSLHWPGLSALSGPTARKQANSWGSRWRPMNSWPTGGWSSGMTPDSVVQISQRSRTLLTYALCGFANFSSIGIQLGGIGGIAPDRRGDLARLGLRAMLGGTLAAVHDRRMASLMLWIMSLTMLT